MYDPTKPYKKEILNLIRETWHMPCKGINHCHIMETDFLILNARPMLTVDHIDGIGTKGLGWWELWRETKSPLALQGAVQDALAMNLNDLLVMRAQPFKLLDHLTICEDDHEAIVGIVRELCEQCIRRQIAVVGGETSPMNTIQGLDISLTVSGFLPRIVRNCWDDGDLLIGLPSSGIHSNGFTEVRRLFPDEWKTYLTPTTIYHDQLWPLLQKENECGQDSIIKCMWHVTGGAFTRLSIPDNFDVFIHRGHSLKQPVFDNLYAHDDEAMYKTFNCGIGFVVSVEEDNCDQLLHALPGSQIIGKINFGTGKVVVESIFSKAEVELSTTKG